MNKAIFLDRDGVINELVYSESLKEFRAPFYISEIKFVQEIFSFCQKMLDENYKLFIVSNQPDYAKGYCSLKDLLSVHNYIHTELISHNIYFTEYYYCYHHPEGIIKPYSYNCECRKPSPFYALKAIEKYDINADESYFIGDRATDMECGYNAGLKTIFKNSANDNYDKTIKSDFKICNIFDAKKVVLKM